MSTNMNVPNPMNPVDAISSLEELVPVVCKEIQILRAELENLRERQRTLVQQLQSLNTG